MACPGDVLHVKITSIGMTACGVTMGSSQGTLHLDSEWAKQMTPGLEIMLKDYKVSWYEDQIHVWAQVSQGACVCIKPTKARGAVTAAEFFSGLGGWSYPVEKAGMDVSVMVDYDDETARCCAQRFKVPCYTAKAYVDEVLAGNVIPKAVICADVEEKYVWMAVGLANVGLVVGSPPCQPWSGAGTGRGLQSNDGMTFATTLEWVGDMGIPLAVLENVKGFAKHSDFQELLRRVNQKNMRLMLNGVFDVKEVIPLKRERWLGTFVHKGVQLEASNVQMANQLSYCHQVFHSVARSPTMDVADVTHLHMKNKDDDFWTKLKDDASDAKYRLITPAELKAFQVAQRKNKAGSTGDNKKEKKAKTKPFVPEANGIKVDMSHFKADGEDIELLEVSRFGPDQTGLVVVDCKEAERCLGTVAKSCDPLALLIIGPGNQKYGQPFNLPAHLTNGSPIVVSAVLYQCGDVPIEFDMKLPSVEVEPLASTVVEFSLHRHLISNWSDTAVPLHYLGVHIPALRGSNLLATWSVRAWAKGKVVHYSQADHWHGYMRIADSLLHQVLSRSGAAGVFMNPRSADRRHDGRYVAIQVPNKTLSEVFTKAEACSDALGVTKMGEGFGIRCKRESAANLRMILSPEGAFVEQAVVDPDQTMFILTNVPQVSRDELTNALAKMGWQATAVKSQGMSRWVVASNQVPSCRHLLLNNNIVMIEQMHKPKEPAQVHVIASEVKVNAVVDANQKTMSISTTSRFAEIRAQVEEQISCVVEQRMAHAHARIEELTNAVQTMQNQSQQTHSAQLELANDVTQLKEEQAYARNKLQEVESTVATSSKAIIEQMGAMFANMETKMANLVTGDPEKRARTGDIAGDSAKHDPFSSK
eukprot:Skav224791  [mRNA]  locus=scaffold764:110792:113496:- [translate_table: standard]